ncbi:putative Zinc finger, RING/FYVE/PHD-type, p53 negative regulator Mdm2/Mdm4 [Plasmopara halstedii]
MALTRSAASTLPTALLVPPMNSVSIPIRFQCPLCLDVLRRPIQLPCCHRYLCMECFERGLELTSVNCGFCRRRVVGFARTKQYKVDEVMWAAIKDHCPFMSDIASDREPLVDFYDENAPPLHNSGEDTRTMSDESAGALSVYYEQQLRRHQSQVHEAEQRAFEQTIHFLQNDPEFTASLAASPLSPQSSSSSPPTEVRTSISMAPSSLIHRPVTRSASNVADETQPKLDQFFSASRATSSHSGHNFRRLHSANISFSPPRRVRTHLKISAPDRKYFLRSNSHSPTPTKERRRRVAKGRKPFRQLTLDTTISPIALHTRSRDLKRNSTVDCASEPFKMLTRQSQRRSSWKCTHCTYTNTCFDNRCSMCRSPTSVFSNASACAWTIFSNVCISCCERRKLATNRRELESDSTQCASNARYAAQRSSQRFSRLYVGIPRYIVVFVRRVSKSAISIQAKRDNFLFDSRYLYKSDCKDERVPKRDDEEPIIVHFSSASLAV